MDEAIAAGLSRRRVFRMVARGDWLQFHPGIYFPLFGLQHLSTRVVPRKRRRAANICYSVDELSVDELAVDELAVDEGHDLMNRVDTSAQEEVRKRWSDAKNRAGEESFWKATLTGRLLYGAEGHTGGVARSRDLQRQNKLFRGFVLLRFTAVDILRDPDAAAEEVRRATLRSDVFHGGWTVGEVTVKYSTNHFVVVDKTRDK